MLSSCSYGNAMTLRQLGPVCQQWVLRGLGGAPSATIPSGAKAGIEGTTLSQGLDLDSSTAANLGIQTLPNKMFLKTCHALCCAKCWCRVLPTLGSPHSCTWSQEERIPGRKWCLTVRFRVKGGCKEKVAWHLGAEGQNPLPPSYVWPGIMRPATPQICPSHCPL